MLKRLNGGVELAYNCGKIQAINLGKFNIRPVGFFVEFVPCTRYLS